MQDSSSMQQRDAPSSRLLDAGRGNAGFGRGQAASTSATTHAVTGSARSLSCHRSLLVIKVLANLIPLVIVGIAVDQCSAMPQLAPMSLTFSVINTCLTAVNAWREWDGKDADAAAEPAGVAEVAGLSSQRNTSTQTTHYGSQMSSSSGTPAEILEAFLGLLLLACAAWGLVQVFPNLWRFPSGGDDCSADVVVPAYLQCMCAGAACIGLALVAIIKTVCPGPRPGASS
eukprot:TRINITY_DN42012_c0_g2_i1.p1 TRINITY_DN42012_c0_g2~~TRINITY_DN42012_c0_g2_i1.p1  ORF type:complete len:241 (-),score=21.55 TRINITY_DN42012_c0_g2_i1:116-802(-)